MLTTAKRLCGLSMLIILALLMPFVQFIETILILFWITGIIYVLLLIDEMGQALTRNHAAEFDDIKETSLYETK